MSEEMNTLKARILDTEDALRVSQTNFNALVSYLIETLGIPSESLEDFVEKLKAKLNPVADSKEVE